MLKIFLASLMLMGTQTFAADGAIHLKATTFGAYMDLESNKNVVEGTMSFGGSPFVKLTKGDHGWQGSFGGRQVAETKVKVSADKQSADVEITVLPGGTYTLHFAHKERVGMTISGMNARGELISAAMKHPKHDFQVSSGRASAYLAPARAAGAYTGNLVVERRGRMAQSDLELQTAGVLDFHALMHKDPALFSLLFIASIN